MRITTLFFGATADLVGKREIELDFGNASTVGEMIERLNLEHPALIKHKLLVALNEEYVSLDTSVRDGDTLAIFTAVSGG